MTQKRLRELLGDSCSGYTDEQLQILTKNLTQFTVLMYDFFMEEKVPDDVQAKNDHEEQL